MSEDRRFSEEEVAEILESATTQRDARSVARSTSGLTLQQLQEIGSEVGIDPKRISQAATALTRRGQDAAAIQFLGAPRSVHRTVPLDRPLTDHEWNRLVADLRETFSARGKIETHGMLRTWSNGNLQVHVEPSGDAYRVRMMTVKGNVSEFASIALGMVSISLLLIVLYFFGVDPKLLTASGFFGIPGLGLLAYARAQLPGWAATRGAQMDGLAERIPQLLASPEGADPA